MEVKSACIIGGTSGLGLSLAHELRLNNRTSKIVIVGRKNPQDNGSKLDFIARDLSVSCSNWNFCAGSDLIIYAAGMGRLTRFDNISQIEIEKTICLNATNVLNIIAEKKNKLLTDSNFTLAVVTSIAARLPSPMFALYSASKALVHNYIVSVNIELSKNGSKNKILEIAPGFLQGTSFYGKPTDLAKLKDVSQTILKKIYLQEEYIVPENKVLYERVINRSKLDPKKFGLESYDHKISSGRVDT